VRERLANAKASEVILAAIALCLVLVAGAWGLVLNPWQRSVASRQKQIEETRSFVEEAKKYVNVNPADVVAGRLYTFSTLSSFPTDLEAAAKLAGAVITAVRMGNATPVQPSSGNKQGNAAGKATGGAPGRGQSEKPSLMKVPVTVTIESAYNALIQFLRRIEQMKQHVTVTGLEVTSPADPKAPLECKAEMEVLVYNPPGDIPVIPGASAATPSAPKTPSQSQPFRAALPTEEEPTAEGGPPGEPSGFPAPQRPEPPSEVFPLLEQPAAGSGETAAPARRLPLPPATAPGRPHKGQTVRASLGEGSTWPHLAGTIRANGRGVAVIDSGGRRFTFKEGAQLAPGVNLRSVGAGHVTIDSQPLLRGHPVTQVVRVGEPLRGVVLEAPGGGEQYPQIVCILQGENGPVAVVREGAQAYTVRPGDVLAGGVTVKRIDENGVVMEAHGDELHLTAPRLESPKAGGSRGRSGVTAPRAVPPPESP